MYARSTSPLETPGANIAPSAAPAPETLPGNAPCLWLWARKSMALEWCGAVKRSQSFCAACMQVSAARHPSHLCSTVFMVQFGEFEPFRLDRSSWSSTTSSLVFSRRFCSTADAIKCSDVRSGRHRLVDMRSARHRTLVLFLASFLVAIRGHALELAAGLFSGVAGAIRVALRPDFHAIHDGVNTRSRQGNAAGCCNRTIGTHGQDQAATRASSVLTISSYQATTMRQAPQALLVPSAAPSRSRILF